MINYALKLLVLSNALYEVVAKDKIRPDLILEKSGVSRNQNQQIIKQLAKSTDHNIQPRDTQILERIATKYHKRLFLESWTFHPHPEEITSSHLLTVDLKK